MGRTVWTATFCVLGSIAGAMADRKLMVDFVKVLRLTVAKG